jgi:hypothetical protein
VPLNYPHSRNANAQTQFRNCDQIATPLVAGVEFEHRHDLAQAEALDAEGNEAVRGRRWSRAEEFWRTRQDSNLRRA